jgi:polysaccharide biosynthesis protein PslH
VTISILWLGRALPIPLNAGDRIYSAQLAGAVGRQGAQVAFLGLKNPDDQTGSLADLEARVRWEIVPGAPNAKLLALFSNLPMVGARFATNHYRKAIAHELEAKDYDVVVFDQYGMCWALPYVQQFARNRPVLVHVSHDFETRVTDQIASSFTGDLLRKFLLKKNACKTKQAEQFLAHSSNLLVTLTEEDRAAFNEINPSLPCIVLPPGFRGTKQHVRALSTAIPRRAIIVGSFSWIAKQINLERLLEAASSIFTQHDVELQVVGVIPEPLLSRFQQRFPWVVFRGFVDDLGEEFRNARVALVPEEIGGGFKLKILDYIFSRVPIAAVETALNGIPTELKMHFITEGAIPELLKAVVAAIDDTNRLEMMQKRAFELAENLFNWDVNGRLMLKSLEDIAHEYAIETHLPKSARS